MNIIIRTALIISGATRQFKIYNPSFNRAFTFEDFPPKDLLDKTRPLFNKFLKLLIKTHPKDETEKQTFISPNTEKYIDKGGFSHVFEGLLFEEIKENDFKFSKKIVIKVIPYNENYNVTNSDEKDIEQEIKILCFLNSFKDFNGCVDFLGYSKIEKLGVFYLILEYLDTDLYKFIKSKVTLEHKTIISMVYQMISILSFLQKNGILHRDLKPKNFLLKIPETDDPDEIRLKICDFGAAQLLGDLNINSKITGTKDFLAPELREKLINIFKSAKTPKKDNDVSLEEILVEKVSIPPEDLYSISEEFDVISSSCFESDVFSFALNVLYLLERSGIRGCNSDESILKKTIGSLNRLKLSDLTAILSESLSWNPENRPDFIFLEDFIIYILHIPLKYYIKFDWSIAPRKYISKKCFEEIKNIDNKDKIQQYFISFGWKSTRMSKKFLEQIYLASNKKEDCLQLLLESIKANIENSSEYEKIFNSKEKPFQILCHCYSIETNTSKTSLYRILNQDLGYEKTESDITLKFLRSFLREFPEDSSMKPKQKVVYRGVACPNGFHETAFKLRYQYLPGVYFYWTAFVSGSKNEKVALEFIENNSSQSEGILFKIILNDDRNRKFDIESISSFKIEEEVLIAPYFFFKVISNEPIKTENNKNICCITLEEVREKKIQIIWVDKNTSTDEYSQYCYNMIKELGLDIIVFQDQESALGYIQGVKIDLFVMASGSIGKELFPQIENYENVIGLGVYCMDVEKHKVWANSDKISKLVFITNEFEYIYSFFKLYSSY